jgi:hypothetical protein
MTIIPKITLLDSDDKVNYLIHISDIHISKNNDRHDEFRNVFNYLDISLKDLFNDKLNSNNTLK